MCSCQVLFIVAPPRDYIHRPTGGLIQWFVGYLGDCLPGSSLGVVPLARQYIVSQVLPAISLCSLVVTR